MGHDYYVEEKIFIIYFVSLDLLNHLQKIKPTLSEIKPEYCLKSYFVYR